ncbi:hypothetical protein KBX06_01045 [Micromonospora sp. C31]|uniref:hypothetical protein n=1 Tax=Micromonospora sp. C31 TaxID=2824876 RepID=UPI001B3584A6|nr:hypothetical protein [Micromonospora sp. C31]MBQ1071760.1 hypothetical protein [Micromonospora sp. C31]
MLALAYPLGVALLLAAVLAGRRAGDVQAGPFGDGSLIGGGRSRPDSPTGVGTDRP